MAITIKNTIFVTGLIAASFVCLCCNNAEITPKNAVEAKILKAFRAEIENGGNPNKIFDEGFTLLQVAAIKGYLTVVVYLLDKGADIEATDENGRTALHCVAVANKPEVAKLLIKRGAKIDARNNKIQDYEPVHLAAYCGSLEVLKILVEAGANVNSFAAGKESPLDFAAREGKVEVAKYLISAGAKVNPDVDKDGPTPLHIACYEGKIDMVRLLIKNGADAKVKCCDEYMTKYGAEHANREMLKMLINAGCPLEIFSAIYLKDDEALKNIIHDDPKSINETTGDGGDVLSYSIEHNNIFAFKYLIDNGANVNASIDRGLAPMHWAAWNVKLEYAELLIQNKANVNASSDTCGTPLHIAVTKNNVPLVTLLIKNGADLTMKNIIGQTPLDVAKKEGNIEIIDILTSVSEKIPATATKPVPEKNVDPTTSTKPSE